jgi:hypothetical protein
MDDIDDIQLKSEIDAIMKNVDNIMKSIEAVMPPKEKEPTQEES